jgi:hypothetical protein
MVFRFLVLFRQQEELFMKNTKPESRQAYLVNKINESLTLLMQFQKSTNKKKAS